MLKGLLGLDDFLGDLFHDFRRSEDSWVGGNSYLRSSDCVNVEFSHNFFLDHLLFNDIESIDNDVLGHRVEDNFSFNDLSLI